MKIPLELIPTAYDISKKVYENKLTSSEGTNKLAGKGMNENSANDYIYNFRCLMQGKKFSRTLNTASMEYFFSNLLKDYGAEHLSKPLSALIQHIEYYEGQQKHKTTMRQMRLIHKKYSEQTSPPTLITSFGQLVQNIETIENYLTEGSDNDRLDASMLIKKGTCFVAYMAGQELRFAPSRFLGYQNNNLFKHQTNDIDGRETNKAINKILESIPLSDGTIDEKYIAYCITLGIEPQLKGGTFSHPRKYWQIDLKHDFRSNDEVAGEFPEGKIVERIHKTRERNSKVIELAKRNFKKLHGRLFCQICEFDFEDTYGDVGENFIEGHHTIAVSKMAPNYKSKPEEIAMLCSNCHRMVHKKRPWLTMKQLSKLLKK